LTRRARAPQFGVLILLIAASTSVQGLGCQTASGVLAFSSTRNGNTDIVIADADGNDIRAVLVGTTQELEPSWHPSGERLAYQSRRPSWSIYTATPEGEDEVRMTSSLSWSPAWSPDGEWIAYSTGSAIYRVDPGGNGRERLVSGPSTGRPSWSPDGRLLAFHSALSGNVDVCVLDLASGDIRQVTTDPGKDFMASWSPDGERLVFASDRDGDHEIYSIHSDGTDLQQLTDNVIEDVLPAWSPDAQWIAFVSNRDGNREIYLMRPDGSCQTRLTDNPGDDMYPAWRPIGDG